MEAREKLMRDYLAAWNDRDAERIASFFAEDAIYDDRGAGEVASGRGGIREHVARVHRAFPDLRFELVRAAHGDEFTAGEWRSVMTHLGSGRASLPRVAWCKPAAWTWRPWTTTAGSCDSTPTTTGLRSCARLDCSPGAIHAWSAG
jgi:uncharacterized protein (TIGR02246 family)